LLDTKSATKADDAAKRIVAKPALLAELKASVRDIEAMGTPAEPADVLQELLAHVVALGLGGRNTKAGEQWNEMFRPYLDTLTEFPITLLRQAFADWHAGKAYPDPKDFGRHAFYPKPAELCHLMREPMLQIKFVQYRAQVALSGKFKGPDAPISDEERAKVREQMAAWKAEIAAKGMPKFETPKMSPQQTADRLRAMAYLEAETALPI